MMFREGWLPRERALLLCIHSVQGLGLGLGLIAILFLGSGLRAKDVLRFWHNSTSSSSSSVANVWRINSSLAPLAPLPLFICICLSVSEAVCLNEESVSLVLGYIVYFPHRLQLREP